MKIVVLCAVISPEPAAGHVILSLILTRGTFVLCSAPVDQDQGVIAGHRRGPKLEPWRSV